MVRSSSTQARPPERPATIRPQAAPSSPAGGSTATTSRSKRSGTPSVHSARARAISAVRKTAPSSASSTWPSISCVSSRVPP